MSFVCQQCKQPLQLDESLIDLTPSAYDVIASALPPKPRPTQLTDEEKLAQMQAPEESKAAWKRSVEALSSKAKGKQPQRNMQPGESYVFLQDSVVQKTPSSPVYPRRTKRFSLSMEQESILNKPPKPPQSSTNGAGNSSPTPLSHHLRSTVKLFSLLSSRTEIDFPLCAECAHILISSLERQLEETKRERDGYVAYEKEWKKEREREKEKEDEKTTKEDFENQLEKLKLEEQAAIDDLREAQRQKDKLDEEMKALDLEEKELEEEEAE